MIVKEKMGNLASFPIGSRMIDYLVLEWYEITKRILHKRTESGREVAMKFLNETNGLELDDVLYADEHSIVVIDIKPCEAIVMRPATLDDMAWICYEIGNKHLPLFYQDGELLVPYEAPLHRLLQASGFECSVAPRKLYKPLKTTVAPHLHAGGGSLFSRILQLTANGK
ncbi:MAG TPA: urease accessory protein UreE [Flavisolibacter sp.]|nr:urease accessory protein UreE [Flavisolibacter sp.]